MRTVCRWIYRGDKLGIGDGRGHATATLRVFLESDVNRGALFEPIFGAVSSVVSKFEHHGLALLDAMDTIRLTDLLARMRGLDLFSEQSLASYMSIALCNQVSKILDPVVPKPVKAKAPAKPPRSVTRIPENERNIALGLDLLALRSTIKNNLAFGRQVRRQFEIDAKQAAEAMKVARVYGKRPEIFSRLSWNALLRLSSPALPSVAREALERRIVAGERITTPVIRTTGEARKPGKRHADQPARRMAA
jgi:hypothetical protein